MQMDWGYVNQGGSGHANARTKGEHTMSKRIIAKGQQHYVKYCTDWQEYTVYDKQYPDMTSHHSDKQDALDTMEKMDRDYIERQVHYGNRAA